MGRHGVAARRTVLAAALLTGGAAGTARAQGPELACTPSARDTVAVTVYVRPVNVQQMPPDRLEARLGLARTLAAHVEAPAGLLLPTILHTAGTSGVVHYRAAFGILQVGDVVSDSLPPRYVEPSMVPGVDSVVLAAAGRAWTRGGWSSLRPPVLPLSLEIGAATELPAHALPLFPARMVAGPLDQEVRVLFQDQPSYPQSLLEEGVEVRSAFLFVIGADGRADPSSLRMLDEVPDDFARAARGMVTRSRYAPARSAGCPVAQLVRQSLWLQLAD